MLLTRFDHRVDILEPTKTTNNAGQVKNTWAVTTSQQKCFYTPDPVRGEWSTNPIVEQNELFYLVFDAKVSISDFARFTNINDRLGNSMNSDLLEIYSLTTVPGWGGIARHTIVAVRRVEEK